MVRLALVSLARAFAYVRLFGAPAWWYVFIYFSALENKGFRTLMLGVTTSRRKQYSGCLSAEDRSIGAIRI